MYFTKTIPIQYGRSAVTVAMYGWRDIGLQVRVRFGSQSATAFYLDLQILTLHVGFFYWKPL
jgi:hypothetical protein